MSAFKSEAELKRFAKKLTLFDLVAIWDQFGMQVHIDVVPRTKPPAPATPQGQVRR